MSDESHHYGLALSDACAGYAALKPPNRVSVSQGATDNLVIRQPGAAGGAWSASETPYMVGPMDALASRQHEAVIFTGPARTGKCLDLATEIPTPTGWTTMGELRAGDIVFSDTGAPTEVLLAHEVKHGLPCYEVTLADGSSLIADGEHLWGVERFYWKAPNWRYEVRTTEELLGDFRYAMKKDGKGRFRYRIRNAKPIACRERGLLIDPYILGAWLGNGVSDQATLSHHIDDAAHYEAAIRQSGHSAASRPDGENTVCTRIDLVGTNTDNLFGSFSQRLTAMGVRKNKHIPAEYLRASETQRWALLRGLMDTDGYAGDESHTSVEFSTVLPALKDGFLELARSLGLKPVAKEKVTTWTYKGEREFGKAFRITFAEPEGVEVFTLPRKRIVKTRPRADVGYRQIVDIQPVASRPVRCIQVDAPSSLFLAGHGMVPTHNTAGLLLGWMAHNVVNDPGDMLFIQMTKDEARRFSKTDVDRALRNSPNVHAMKSTRAIDSNTFDTMFRHGMFLRIAWPTIGNVSGSTYRYVAITDIDRIENADNVDGEGPLFDLAKKRTTTFLSRGMTLVESSPGYPLLDPTWQPATNHEAPPTGGILNLYNRSDRQRWYWRCLDCRDHFEAAPGLKLFNLPNEQQLLEEVRSANIPALARAHSRIVCPHCGSMIEAKHKTELNARGQWVPDNVILGPDGEWIGTPMESSIAGYWLGGVAATYQSWNSLVENYLMGLRDYALTNSEEKLKQTTTTDQGAPYMSRRLAESRTAGSTPLERAETGLQRYVVPDWTRCLLGSVDVQGGIRARFIVQIHAVGPFLEQQLVDRFEITESKRTGMGTDFAPIDPASNPEDWDLLTEKLLLATWRTPIDGLEIKMKMLTVDTGGEDGVTASAYAWYRKARLQGHAARITLYKGASEPKAPIMRETRVGKRNAKDAGDIPLVSVNPNLVKDMVFAALNRKTPGPGYYYFPQPKHPTKNPTGWLPAAFFDELDAEVRNPNGTYTQVKKRNESIDLCVMILVGAMRLGLDKLRSWDVVAPWIAPLAQNSEIVATEDRRAARDNVIEQPQVAVPVRVLAPRPRARRQSVANL